MIISARLLLLILIGGYIGAYFLFFYFGFDFLCNLILFDHGLLGEDRINAIGYIISILNLGLTPRDNHRVFKCQMCIPYNGNINWLAKIYQNIIFKCVLFMQFINIIPIQSYLKNNSNINSVLMAGL